ncbi:MAG: hypothetical protein IPH50_14850 [Rhodanobacteraceae bacterium]|nr:hypothetical protein [Rhodanobacteraceae bacterium]
MPHPGIDDAEGESNTEIISVPTIPRFPAAKALAALVAESIDEQTATVIAEVGDAKLSESFHSRAAHARNAFMDVRQGLWARDQWDALNRIEMQRSIRRGLACRVASDERDVMAAESALLMLLIGCTGWTEDRLWTVPFVRMEAPFRKAIIDTSIGIRRTGVPDPGVGPSMQAGTTRARCAGQDGFRDGKTSIAHFDFRSHQRHGDASGFGTVLVRALSG